MVKFKATKARTSEVLTAPALSLFTANLQVDANTPWDDGMVAGYQMRTESATSRQSTW